MIAALFAGAIIIAIAAIVGVMIRGGFLALRMREAEESPTQFLGDEAPPELKQGCNEAEIADLHPKQRSD